MEENKHIFSLFWAETTQNISLYSWLIEDTALVHRIVNVLRLKERDQVILFDRTYHGIIEITEIRKRTILCTKKIINKNLVHRPGVTCFLPLLKTEQLEDAVYGLTESGVSRIQLLITDKVHNKRYTDQIHNRLEKIIIAAAEQSKCYTFAQLSRPLPFLALFEQYNDIDLFLHCDIHGNHINSMIGTIITKQQIGLIVGPEGDLTAKEKIELRKRSVTLVRLTPTILRASKAAVLATGIIRSLDFSNNSC
jgi:16S rRNA (uracil1498-N3)-methyltransferase